MRGAVLVTGERILAEAHIARFEQAGLTVHRLQKPNGTDDELIEALRGKRAYVCAGMERVSAAVIAAAAELEVIAFPGSGYTEYIPGWQEATDRGISVSAQIGVNAPSVAEFTLTLMLMMLRRVPALLRDDDPGPWPARELESLCVGVVGFGYSGRRVALLCQQLGMKVVIAGRRPIAGIPVGVEQVELTDLLRKVNVVTIHVDRVHGVAVLDEAAIGLLTSGTLVLNVAFPEAVDWPSLRTAILDGRLRAAYDAPPHGNWHDLPPSRFLALPRQAAFDTSDSNDRIGHKVVDAILALLSGEGSASVVNPSYVSHREEHRAE
jgi:phosphoglycerate dehydrogenase-like enzyme